MHTWLLTARLIHYRILDYRSRTARSRLTDGATDREKAGFQFARRLYPDFRFTRELAREPRPTGIYL